MNRERKAHARQFLAGLILCVAAGSATLWWITGFFLAMAYASGAATVLLFAKLAPSYQPDIEEDTDQNPGFQ